MKKIDVETGRVAVTLSRASIPASPALYLRSLLSEMFAAKAASDPGTDSAAGSAGEVTTSTRRRFEFGVTCNATVVAVKEYGVVLKASPRGGSEGSKNGDGEGQLMLCSAEYAPEGVKEGLEVKVRQHTRGRIGWLDWVEGIGTESFLSGESLPGVEKKNRAAPTD